MLEPNVIFDKSFIEMLNVDELRELCMFFQVVSTPILRSEILADLQKKSQEEQRDSMAVMKSLSEKMSRSGDRLQKSMWTATTNTGIVSHGSRVQGGSQDAGCAPQGKSRASSRDVPDTRRGIGDHGCVHKDPRSGKILRDFMEAFRLNRDGT